MNLLFYELVDLGLAEEDAQNIVDEYGCDEERIQTNIDYSLNERCHKEIKNFTGFLQAAIRHDYATNGSTKWRSSGDWKKKPDSQV